MTGVKLDADVGRSPPASLAAVSERFDWSPEPELIDVRDEARSRAALEALGEQTWREALDWLYGEAMRRPMHGRTYPQARRMFFCATNRPASAPISPALWNDVLAEFRERIAPATYNAQHPGSFSYFTPPPLPGSIAGETLAQWIHQGVDVWHAGPIGTFVEEEVTAWLRDLIGFGREGWGVLTSGGVMANLMAMTVARDVRLAALRSSPGAPRGADLDGVRVYASDQTHFSISRALGVLGFPSDTLQVIESDDGFRLRAAPVEAAIERDRAAGLTPLSIAAGAGSTNTGSVDDVAGLADVAERAGLWLHVDAAYGAAARLSPRDAHRVPAIERADSVTVDPHKWFFPAYDIGALIVRRREDMLATFHQAPEYYASSRPEDEPLDWYQYSIEGTRRFRALKLWMSWKQLGTAGLGRLIEDNDDLAAYLAARCTAEPDFEAVPAEPELSIVCFRHLPAGHATWPLEELDRYESRLQRALELSGDAWVSVTTLRGRTFLRAGVVNYLSTPADVDVMLEALRRSSPQVQSDLGLA
ncbi:pyridoxal-dependent decarboxylase [soil metagenome]